MALPDLGRIEAVLAEIAELMEGFPGAWLGTLPAFGTRGWRPASGETAQGPSARAPRSETQVAYLL
jgi:hypothetical protein